MIKPFTTILGYIAMILVILQISGIDLAVAQVSAWAEMIKDRQAEQGPVEAVLSTISGKAPCERCIRIAQEKEKRDQDQNLAQSSLENIKLTLSADPRRTSPREIPYKSPSLPFLSRKLSSIYLEVQLPPPKWSV